MAYHQLFINAPVSSPFTSSPSLLSSSASICKTFSRPPVGPSMKQEKGEDSPKGFGKPKQSNNIGSPSESTERRKAASSRYDDMVASGMPEYTVWFRLKKGGIENEEEEMPWLPVGAISVPRSSQVADALFEPKTEADLIQGAIRLYPKLQNENRDNIEFGYQLKEFDDEPIRVAVPTPSSGWQAAVTNFFRKIQNPLNISQKS